MPKRPSRRVIINKYIYYLKWMILIIFIFFFFFFYHKWIAVQAVTAANQLKQLGKKVDVDSHRDSYATAPGEPLN